MHKPVSVACCLCAIPDNCTQQQITSTFISSCVFSLRLACVHICELNILPCFKHNGTVPVIELVLHMCACVCVHWGCYSRNLNIATSTRMGNPRTQSTITKKSSNPTAPNKKMSGCKCKMSGSNVQGPRIHAATKIFFLVDICVESNMYEVQVYFLVFFGLKCKSWWMREQRVEEKENKW